MVPRVALHVAQIDETQTKAPALVRLAELQQPVINQRVLAIKRRLVAIADLSDAIHLTGQIDTDAMFGHALSGHLPALRCPTAFPQGLPGAARL